MAYRRFRLPEKQIRPATVANLATVQATKPQNCSRFSKCSRGRTETGAAERPKRSRISNCSRPSPGF